jgi:crotonyl-CoA carboxylase/reductase
VLDVHKHPFHIAGSDASGIVWAVGAKVKRWKVGDEVIVHCNQDDGDDEECNGGDPMFSPSQRIWGYETPDGSFAQFCRVQSASSWSVPKHLTWEESACYTLTLATAYRMLFGHAPHTPEAGRQCAGLGRLRRPRRVRRAACAAAGANDRRHLRRTKRDYVMSLGAKGVINRKDFDGCWGQMPTVNTPEFNAWTKEARKFGKAIWDITGKKDVDIVFEHPGRSRPSRSCLVVKRGGMVVFCAGTTGFNLTFDARYVWMRQKRVQGSHFAHLKQAAAANQFVLDRRVDPCMSEVFPWDKIPPPTPRCGKTNMRRQHGRAGQRPAAGSAQLRRRAGRFETQQTPAALLPRLVSARQSNAQRFDGAGRKIDRQHDADGDQSAARLRQNVMDFLRQRRRNLFRPGFEQNARSFVGQLLGAEHAGERRHEDQKGKQGRQNRQGDMAGDRPAIVLVEPPESFDGDAPCLFHMASISNEYDENTSAGLRVGKGCG